VLLPNQSFIDELKLLVRN